MLLADEPQTTESELDGRLSRSVFQTVTIKPKRTKQDTIAFRKGGVRVEAEKSQDDDDDKVNEPGSIVPAAISFGVGQMS